MAIYRNIQLTFWTDTKVTDDFTPEDKYFYLYLLTNPHTNLCGCYEISLKQMSDETGYTKETIEKLINRMETIHKVIAYDRSTKEIIIFNWHKYNWTKSGTFQIALEKEINPIKTDRFKQFLIETLSEKDTVSIPYAYPMDTTVTVSVTDTVSDTVSDTVQSVIDSWNTLPLAKVIKWDSNSTRGKSLKKLLSKYGTDGVLKGIEKIRESHFLLGQNQTGWAATIDWFVKPNNFVKVIEGQYTDKQAMTPSQQVSQFYLWNGDNDDGTTIYDNSDGT